MVKPPWFFCTGDTNIHTDRHTDTQTHRVTPYDFWKCSCYRRALKNWSNTLQMFNCISMTIGLFRIMHLRCKSNLEFDLCDVCLFGSHVKIKLIFSDNHIQNINNFTFFLKLESFIVQSIDMIYEFYSICNNW